MKLPVVLGILAAATTAVAFIPFERRDPAAPKATAQELGVFGRADARLEQVNDLRVTTRDGKLQTVEKLHITRDAKLGWVIASLNNYPADQKDGKVFEVARSILRLPRSGLVTTDKSQFEALGVLDPDPQGTAPLAKDGYGKRVEVRDASGAVLAALIIGNVVKREDDRMGGGNYRYVREADSDAVYRAELADEWKITTKATDYLQADPFTIKSDDVTSVAISDFSVGEQGITLRAQTELTKDGENWTSAAAPMGKRPAKDKVSGIVSTLGSMRLNDVVPLDESQLRQRGFFLTADANALRMPGALQLNLGGQPIALVSAEGRLDVRTRTGRTYTFLFGRAAPEAAKKDEDKKDGDKKDGAETAPADTNQPRSMVVFLTYDPKNDPGVLGEAKDGKPAQPDPTKVAKAQAEVDRLAARFGSYFYVIENYHFTSLRPGTDTLFEDLPEHKTQEILGGKSVAQWLEENGKKEGVTTTTSGLQYQVLARGPADGMQPTAADKVIVAYKGTLVDGKEFDANENMEFTLGGVIKGWTEGLQLMRVGDQFRFWIKPSLAYGDEAKEKIPANSLLVFEVTLKGVVRPEAPKPAEAPKGDAPKTEAPPADAPKP